MLQWYNKIETISIIISLIIIMVRWAMIVLYDTLNDNFSTVI